MDKEQLKQLYYLSKEIEMWEDAKKRIRDISLVPSMEITGMPFGHKISDKVGDTATKLADFDIKIKELKIARVKEYGKLLDYIKTVDDSFIRQILYYRHIACMSWQRVAMAIGGGNTADGVRMAHDRFLNK